MDNRVKQYLFDIEQSIAELESFMVNIHSFEEFEENKLVKRAVERGIEIIGEAMSRTLKIDPAINISNAREIVDTRN